MSKRQSVHSMTRERNRLLRENVELLNAATTRKKVLANSFSSLVQGIIGQDNITSFDPMIRANIYGPLTLNYNALMYFYKTHGVVQTIIDEPVRDALRGGIEITSNELDAHDLGDFEDYLEERGTLEKFAQALIWARLFGGSGMVINAEYDPTQPLDRAKLGKGRLDFYPASRWELGAGKRYDAKYTFYGETLDPSRVLTFGNKPAPWIIRQQLQGWDMCEVERLVEDFNLFLRGRNVMYELLNEAKVDVFKLEGFREDLASQVGTESVERRVGMANQLKTFESALLLDKLDDYEQKQITFTGLAEVMKENRMMIAAAARMPISKIWGVGSQGLSSGEDDIENYNGMIESQVREPNKPNLRKVIKLEAQVFFGGEYDLGIKFRPLRTMTAKEEEEVKTSKQERYIQQYDRGLLDSKEWGQISQKEQLVPIETKASKGELEDFPEAPMNMGMLGDDVDGKGQDDKKDKKNPKGGDE